MNLRGRGRRNARVTGGRRGGEKRGEEDRGRKGNALRKDGGRREDGYTRITPPARGVFVHVLGLADDRHAPDQPRRNSVGRVGARATARRSSALLLSSSATVNDDHLPIHFYSLLSLSLSLRLLFCESSEMPLPFPPRSCSSIDIHSKGVSDHPPLAVPSRRSARTTF